MYIQYIYICGIYIIHDIYNTYNMYKIIIQFKDALIKLINVEGGFLKWGF